MDLLTVLVVFCAAAAMVSLLVSSGTSRGLDAFGAGFLPYRDGSRVWPRGVQEEDPVAWAWSSRGTSGPPGGRSGPPGDQVDAGLESAEVVDIDGDEAPAATRVHRRSTFRGLAVGRR